MHHFHGTMDCWSDCWIIMIWWIRKYLFSSFWQLIYDNPIITWCLTRRYYLYYGLRKSLWSIRLFSAVKGMALLEILSDWCWQFFYSGFPETASIVLISTRSRDIYPPSLISHLLKIPSETFNLSLTQSCKLCRLNKLLYNFGEKPCDRKTDSLCCTSQWVLSCPL